MLRKESTWQKGVVPRDRLRVEAQKTSGVVVTDRKTMAFILLVAEGDPGAHTSAISRVDNFRRGFLAYGNGPATGGRGRFDTVLHPAIH